MVKPTIAQAILTCDQGDKTSSLQVTSQNIAKLKGKCFGTITDVAPVTNIADFGFCSSMMNPAVAGATALAGGALQKQRCSPSIVGTWAPSSAVMCVKQQKILVEGSQLKCAYAGNISITETGSSGMTVN